MSHRDDIALMAHLMRRAGFGAPREELETQVAKGYEATVEELIHPEEQSPIDEDILYRYHPGYEGGLAPFINQADWIYRMINTKRPLEENLVKVIERRRRPRPPLTSGTFELKRAHGLGRLRGAVRCGLPST